MQCVVILFADPLFFYKIIDVFFSCFTLAIFVKTSVDNPHMINMCVALHVLGFVCSSEISSNRD